MVRWSPRWAILVIIPSIVLASPLLVSVTADRGISLEEGSRNRPGPNDPVSTANYTLDYTVRLTDIPSTSVAGLGVGDLDNDGRSELVASHGGWVFGKAPPVTSILSFNGSGYEEKGRIENLTMVVWPGLMFQGVAHVVIKDADNDGENELLVPGLFGTERGVHLFEHTAVGFLHSWSVVGEDVEVFDLDGDGSNEIAVPGTRRRAR